MLLGNYHPSEEEEENAIRCFADIICLTVDADPVEGVVLCYLEGNLKGAQDHRVHPPPFCDDCSGLTTELKWQSGPCLLSPASSSENQIFHGWKIWKLKVWRVRAARGPAPF